MSDWLFLGCDSNTCKARGSDILEMDEELKKTIDILSASVKAIQADLRSKVIMRLHTVTITAVQFAIQWLSIWQWPCQEEEEDSGGRKWERWWRRQVWTEGTDTELYQLSEAGGAFIEMTLKSKLDKATRKAHATKYRVPDSRWLKCPKPFLPPSPWMHVEQTDLPVTWNNFGLMLQAC